MSDAKDNDGRPAGSRPLTLKPRPGGSVPSGTVKQSFSHGRSKTVVVETKRRIGAAAPPVVEKRPVFEAPRPAPAAPKPAAPAARRPRTPSSTCRPRRPPAASARSKPLANSTNAPPPSARPKRPARPRKAPA